MKITVPDDIAEWLQHRAEQEGRTPEEVAKSILEDWLLGLTANAEADGPHERETDEGERS